MRILPLLLLVLLAWACGPANENDTITDEMVENDTMDQTPNDQSAVNLTPMPETTDYPNATIRSVDYNNGRWTYNIANYQLGQQTPDADQLMCANSAEGQHIHLIMDNEPYIAKYQAAFDTVFPDGDHHVLTFLSRSYHESIKHASAYKAFRGNFSSGKIQNRQEITEPMLFYSRPKGTYTGRKETENVMLDFYPVNVELGEQYQVKATINGKEFMIDEWQPYYITGLPMGENTITLALIDSSGMNVNVPLNPVTRTITLAADPAEQ